MDGFLPPNTDTLTGQGSIVFDVMVYDTISTGREINNAAAIFFDFNEPIITNTWKLRADNDLPVSKVIALADTQHQRTFTVNWEGSDTGSGIRHYDLLYRAAEANWKYAAVHYDETSIQFTGEPAKQYEFSVIAYDTALNLEVIPVNPEAVTFVASDATVGIQVMEQGRLNLYPNPAQDILYLSISGFHAPFSVSILNISGRVVSNKDFQSSSGQEFSMGIENLAKGIYIVEWKSANGKGISKFIKN